MSDKTLYVWNEKLIEECDRLPAVQGRASMVHELITAYGVLNKIKLVRSEVATYQDLKEFHSELYLDHLKIFNEVDDEYMSTSLDEECGIGYDCPPVSNMFEVVSTIAGASVTAAKCLMIGLADVVINWCGGWHHAHRFGAEGFCYVNDIVIAIEKLRKKFSKILYIDLDVHHGNGVQDAYNLSTSVFTLSFHKFEPGFYPGTGGIDDIGSLAGKGYACNFPLHASYSDETMKYAFDKVFNMVYSCFGPAAIVVQCGADALARDPHGGAGLTARGYGACLRAVLHKRRPTMLLGGGGYNHTNTARLWASLTALVAEVSLDDQIPEHIYWPQYGPSFTIAVEPTLAKDTNRIEYIDDCINTIKGNLEKYLAKQELAEPVLKRLKTETDHTDKELHKHTETGNTDKEIHKQNEKSQSNQNILLKEIPCEKDEVEDVYAFVD